ncbi:hypothetical protein AGDE_16947 [Angomonas deanei]|uniref:Leucine Rich repeat n=1 Tax=Angomonas deanei TaxID=59799 RepID=A0A7G2C6E8_9TRYP|nr:hypothetical protein AGDE_16947 [Angomonas deanei]CAD2215336.1 hypothetical protein, conserved [Angomonas deanei]|eukprot:EPY15839.1 hypothetical protein AGDE_16947 [Angomonas deanei]
MSLFQNISQYTEYFGKSSPLALAAVNSHARECGERHQKGVLGCNVISDDYGVRRILKVNSPDIACLERTQWWIERQRECPLLVSVSFDDAGSLEDITTWERFSGRLSEGDVEHAFALTMEHLESLLPFTVLLKRSEAIVLHICALTTLEALGGLELLTKVELSYCEGSFNVDPLLTCPNLTVVSVVSSHGVTSVEVLGKLRNLREITLRDCDITNVDFLKGCSKLEYADVSDCETLTSLTGLRGLGKLKTLYACGAAIESIEHLSECVELETIDVRGCVNLTSLAGLGGLKGLRTVDASHTSIESIEHLADAWRSRQ